MRGSSVTRAGFGTWGLVLLVVGLGLLLTGFVGLATAAGAGETAAASVAAARKPAMLTYVNSVFLPDHEGDHEVSALAPGDDHDGGCTDEEGELVSLRCSSDLDTALFVGFDKLHAVHNPLQFAVPVIWGGNVWGYDVSVRPGHKAGRLYLVCAERKDS